MTQPTLGRRLFGCGRGNPGTDRAGRSRVSLLFRERWVDLDATSGLEGCRMTNNSASSARLAPPIGGFHDVDGRRVLCIGWVVGDRRWCSCRGPVRSGWIISLSSSRFRGSRLLWCTTVAARVTAIRSRCRVPLLRSLRSCTSCCAFRTSLRHTFSLPIRSEGSSRIGSRGCPAGCGWVGLVGRPASHGVSSRALLRHNFRNLTIEQWRDFGTLGCDGDRE